MRYDILTVIGVGLLAIAAIQGIYLAWHVVAVGSL